jgi:hypothetical protein
MKTNLTAHLLFCVMLLPVLGEAQLVTISGKVKNSISGDMLENVTVFELSSNIGTITNENGFFKLALTKGVREIKITDEGFKEFSQQIVLKNDTTLTVKLVPEIQHKNRHKKQLSLHADVKSEKKIP